MDGVKSSMAECYEQLGFVFPQEQSLKKTGDNRTERESRSPSLEVEMVAKMQTDNGTDTPVLTPSGGKEPSRALDYTKRVGRFTGKHIGLPALEGACAAAGALVVFKVAKKRNWL